MAQITHAPRSGVRSSLRAEREVVLAALAGGAGLSLQSAERAVQIADRFFSFLERGLDHESLDAVSCGDVEGFVRAPAAAGVPSVATMHLRRSMVRLVFRTARSAGLVEGDPSLDLVLPPRSSLRTRPLTDDEVAVCRAASLHTLDGTRLPAAWALAEATVRTSELAGIRVADVDLDAARVWIEGTPRTAARFGNLSAWGMAQLGRRLRAIGTKDPARPVIYEGASGEVSRQASSCAAIADTVRRAGLVTEPDVRPGSVAGWAGWRCFVETGRIEAVAVVLGVSSLDRAAGLIGWDWTAHGQSHGAR